MKRWISFIFSIWLAMNCFAVSYQPMKATGYKSSAGNYSYTQTTSSASFSSTSFYTGGPQVSLSQPSVVCVGSMSAISSANFAELNSEGGACYKPVATAPRRGRPGGGGDSGGGAIGEYDFHSPVGDMPLLLMAALVLAYALKRKIRRKAQ